MTRSRRVEPLVRILRPVTRTRGVLAPAAGTPFDPAVEDVDAPHGRTAVTTVVGVDDARSQTTAGMVVGVGQSTAEVARRLEAESPVFRTL